MSQPRRVFGRVNNVPVEVCVEFARTDIRLGDARRLQENDIIEFDKLAGEAFDVLVNGRRIAEAEIVVVHDAMAARLTRMVPPPEVTS